PLLRKLAQIDPWQSCESNFGVDSVAVIVLGVKALGHPGDPTQNVEFLKGCLRLGLDARDDPDLKERYPESRHTVAPIRRTASEALYTLDRNA
ncbi:MAG: hypothetical protein ACWGQW_20965, partial [bacterium]